MAVILVSTEIDVGRPAESGQAQANAADTQACRAEQANTESAHASILWREVTGGVSFSADGVR